ncbi:hypothetical protein NDN08_004472 [Rhodosorus marinus]|uniref:Uncharacterized protein n=1 Tax=Rhodosorus marinus TaxID=101924 RepID=A0AAV8ULD9_9RHOD|nr:hypothetical protein NDN08_004472 [Rhodosorus marinus]
MMELVWVRGEEGVLSSWGAPSDSKDSTTARDLHVRRCPGRDFGGGLIEDVLRQRVSFNTFPLAAEYSNQQPACWRFQL